MRPGIAALAVLALLQSAPARAGRVPPAAVAITRVTVIDVERGETRGDMTVLVRDGRIASVEPAGARLDRSVHKIDGRGKFLIPGLWDMHVHLSWATGTSLPVLLANGITGVRDCGGDLAEILGWRARIDAGELAGPRIVSCGPMLNGQSFNRFQLETGGPDQARGMVRALHHAGVDFIKVHRRVPRADYFAIVDEAARLGLPVVGHVPTEVSPAEASDAGQQIEHEETLFEGTFSAGMEDAALPDAIRRFRESGEADSLFARFARNATPVTSTVGAWQYMVDHPDTTWLGDPRMRYVPRAVREESRALGLPAEHAPFFARLAAEYAAILPQMRRAGVTLLAGSDLAAARLPGFSLHEELAAMVSAGLSPADALRAATLNPAKVLRRDGDFGRVTAGAVADLVLLDANPLEDIRHTQRVSAVIAAGRVLTRSDLDRLLKSVEDRVREK